MWKVARELVNAHHGVWECERVGISSSLPPGMFTLLGVFRMGEVGELVG